MKKTISMALSATLLAGLTVGTASAGQRVQPRGTVQAPVRADDGFRNEAYRNDGFRESYDAYGRFEPRGNSGLAEGGAISAPAGR